jgi:hypothetical protein
VFRIWLCEKSIQILQCFEENWTHSQKRNILLAFTSTNTNTNTKTQTHSFIRTHTHLFDWKLLTHTHKHTQLFLLWLLLLKKFRHVQKAVVEIEKEDSLIIVSKYWMKWRNMKSLPIYTHSIWFYKHVQMQETVKTQRKLFIVCHSKYQIERYKIHRIYYYYYYFVIHIKKWLYNKEKRWKSECK